MELYEKTAYDLSGRLTGRYSSSFGMASRLFPVAMRRHIYAIYGLVRVADEIVDTYDGSDKLQLLNDLEHETYAAIQRGFSVNPIVQAFALTAGKYGIDDELVAPFFESMRMDIRPKALDRVTYEQYIYGSAEVIGLMCLRVFCAGDDDRYRELAPGARRLGSAYQKVNFLRDLRADYDELGRFYFPGMNYETFDEDAKAAVVADIRQDFTASLPYIRDLPADARQAVMASYDYYSRLLDMLEKTPLAVLKTRRLRLPAYRKLALLVRRAAGGH